jgi:hypothetical protein
MAAGDTPGPSGTAPDKYLEDIFADELSADTTADEIAANRDARRECNRKRNERHRRLQDNLPIRNLVEALEAVESRVHTTPEQCLMSITAIARQAQGIRAREVIAKLTEDAYFMRVDNRVNQPPPARNRDNKATSHSAALGRNRTRAEVPAQPNRTRANTGGPSQGGNNNREVVTALMAAAAVTLTAAATTTAAPTTEPTRGPAAAAVAAVETTRTATPLEPHRVATTPARRFRSCGGRSQPLQATTTASPPSHLRCYALSIENAGGNNDTKCPYFPFCLDQAPLTWLESLDKHSIDKWDQLKEQFTSNFAGAMGRSGTRMDLAMVK